MELILYKHYLYCSKSIQAIVKYIDYGNSIYIFGVIKILYTLSTRKYDLKTVHTISYFELNKAQLNTNISDISDIISVDDILNKC